MHKKLLAVAVAGALAPAAAMAQSAVTISGALNLWYESAGATGATNQTTAASTVSTFDVKSRDRISDGNGSNIRFTMVEDIGGGLQGFGQVESAVLGNAGTRVDGVGTSATTLAASQTANGWGTRNSGVGLRGTAWGEILLGIWDTHYTETYPVDNQLIKGASHSSSLALFNSFGLAGVATGAGSLGGTSIGARYSNVIRYQSPSWAGFNFRASMARPTDGVVPTTAGSVTDGSKNRAWNIVPTYSNGPIYVSWSYLKDKDIVTNQAVVYSGATVAGVGAGATVGSAGAANLSTITSSREAKKTTWAVPISWNTGAHTIFATYAQASKLKGNVAGTDVGSILVTPSGVGTTPISVGDNSKAKFYSLGYQFDLSKRTTLHLTYAQIKNDKLIGYDFFSNTVGMANSNFGADPKIFSLGLRHAF